MHSHGVDEHEHTVDGHPDGQVPHEVPGHAHDHEHPHTHGPGEGAGPAELSAEQAQLGPTSPGSVMLDIGGDIGSLMILTDESLAGAEIEVSLVGEDDRRTHIAIRERRSPAGSRWAGIFPGLKAGDYTVWAVDGTASDVVTVVGGEITELDWS